MNLLGAIVDNVFAGAEKYFFPGKGLGPGFSLSGRPSALDRTLFERGRRIFCMHFYRVS